MHAQGRPRLRSREGGGIKVPPEKSTSTHPSETKTILANLTLVYILGLTEGFQP
jgi:hypothetical protein